MRTNHIYTSDAYIRVLAPKPAPPTCISSCWAMLGHSDLEAAARRRFLRRTAVSVDDPADAEQEPHNGLLPPPDTSSNLPKTLFSLLLTQVGSLAPKKGPFLSPVAECAIYNHLPGALCLRIRSRWAATSRREWRRDAVHLPPITTSSSVHVCRLHSPVEALSQATASLRRLQGCRLRLHPVRGPTTPIEPVSSSIRLQPVGIGTKGHATSTRNFPGDARYGGVCVVNTG